ncbi:MAG: DUF2111 domain-containing protein [Candidatus Methanomethylophilaceae archaeon]
MLSSHHPRLGGPIPKFTDYHLWKALMSLDESRPLGRKKLSITLNIGEGSTRTVLDILSEQEFISIDKNGVILTDKGADARDMVYMEVSPITTKSLTINDYDCAVRVPHVAKKVSFGCEERDAAIKSGASGATTLVYSNGSLIFPGSDYPVDVNMESALGERFRMRNDDVIIIGTANSPENAEKGAVTAALHLIGGLRMNRELKDILSSRSNAGELLSLAFAIHDLVGGLPVCAKSRDDLGIRIENGAVIDNAYTGAVLEEVINVGTTIRKIALSGPYRGTRVIVTPIDVDGRTIAAIGVVDIRSMAGMNNLIRRE